MAGFSRVRMCVCIGKSRHDKEDLVAFSRSCLPPPGGKVCFLATHAGWPCVLVRTGQAIPNNRWRGGVPTLHPTRLVVLEEEGVAEDIAVLLVAKQERSLAARAHLTAQAPYTRAPHGAEELRTARVVGADVGRLGRLIVRHKTGNCHRPAACGAALGNAGRLVRLLAEAGGSGAK